MSALFHGVIRTSHAVQALAVVDTRSRRAELAEALAKWACWFGPGQPTTEDAVVDEPAIAIAQTAAWAAGCYVSQPTIFALHGVTGAMAVHRLSGYLDSFDAGLGLSHLESELRVLYEGVTPSLVGDNDAEWDPHLAERAAASFDSHQIKLVEACRRGIDVTDDPRFVAAARVVTGIHSGPGVTSQEAS